MERDRLYLQHILEAIETLEQYVEGVTFELLMEKNYKAKMLRDAIIREFQILGEATKNLTDTTKERETSIDWQDIVDMRNLVIHEYFGVNYEIIWETIEEDLPKLKANVQKLLAAK